MRIRDGRCQRSRGNRSGTHGRSASSRSTGARMRAASSGGQPRARELEQRVQIPAEVVGEAQRQQPVEPVAGELLEPPRGRSDPSRLSRMSVAPAWFVGVPPSGFLTPRRWHVRNCRQRSPTVHDLDEGARHGSDEATRARPPRGSRSTAPPRARRRPARPALPGVRADAPRVHRRRRSRSASTSSSTSSSTGRSTWRPGSTTSRPAPASSSCTSSASPRSSPASPWRSSRATAPTSSPPGSPGSSSTCSRYSGYYDIALRDFGLMLGALTLARLAAVYDPPLQLRRH